MSYKIAVASSDGKNINETFGSAKSFIVYEVTDGVYNEAEKRIFQSETKEILSNNCNSKGCGNSSGCISGCGGQSNASSKVELVYCRACCMQENRLSYSKTVRAESDIYI